MEYARIDQFCADFGIGRTMANVLIARGDIRAVKCGNRTLIDVPAAKRFFASLAPAEISVPSHPGVRRRATLAAA